MMTSGGRSAVAVGVAIVLLLTFTLAPLVGGPSRSVSPRVVAYHSVACPCGSQITGVPQSQPREYGPSPNSAFDEQIGLTFTQSFTSIEYNVTVEEQTDPTLGDGPAYLLDGVSNVGYWYQVGVSWDWAPGQNPGTGFDMNYEVFDNSGNSVFPTNGQGGLGAFSGPVNKGDVILLSLNFSGSSQSVVMLAVDTNTGATASQVYPSEGGSYFVGLPDSPSNSNGFFTGLMTEWYHGAPYYVNEAGVIYSDFTYPLTSAWMWMDEYNPATSGSIFSANTSAPVSYSNPTKLQEFEFNGTTEYSDAYEFITGALTNVTQKTTSSVPLKLSYTVKGGGVGYSPPVLTYVSNGTIFTVTLSGTPTTYQIDVGTTWRVTAQLNGSTSKQRWETDQQATGIANSSLAVQFIYYNQDYVTFGFSVSGGGSGFSPPTVTYTSFGSSANTSADVGVWADSGSRYEYSSVLPGSTQSQRWYANLEASVSSSEVISAIYYHQYLITFDITFRDTGLLPGLPLNLTSAGTPSVATLISGTNFVWTDSGSVYSVPQTFSLASGERVIGMGALTGNVSASLVVSLTYQGQFYITITSNVAGGGTLSPPSGWYDSGSELDLDANSSSGWRFEGWEGVGTDSVSGSSSSVSLTVGPGTPAQETAVFYPGVTIHATGPMSVSYKDGSVSGTVSAGEEVEVYVPPSSEFSLSTPSVPFLISFEGWRGSSNSTNTVTSILVDGPEVVTSSSEYNYLEIGILVLTIALVVIAGTLFLTKRRRPDLQTIRAISVQERDDR